MASKRNDVPEVMPEFEAVRLAENIIADAADEFAAFEAALTPQEAAKIRTEQALETLCRKSVAWMPEVGQGLVGKVVNIDQYVGKTRNSPIYYIQCANGEVLRFHVFQPQTAALLIRKGAKIGRTVAVKLVSSDPSGKYSPLGEEYFDDSYQVIVK
jgi:hypothetical protein